MRVASLSVQRAGYAVVQDLGRPGYATIGIASNGAGDQRSARTANTLVGNADNSALIEIVGSDFEAITDTDVILAATGAADEVVVDGYPQRAWEALFVAAGAHIAVPTPRAGQRSYLAINGVLEAERALGSVSPDPHLGVGRRLEAGDTLEFATSYEPQDRGTYPEVFRLAARRLRLGGSIQIRATPGPDLDRLVGGADTLAEWFDVLPQSDTVGVRLTGAPLSLTMDQEILSRGVPVGAVEIPPSGELLILLRGRLVTAGYPVAAVLTTASIDTLTQAGPGDRVRLSMVDLASARTELEALSTEHRSLAARVARAFEARGLAHLLAADHAGVGVLDQESRTSSTSKPSLFSR